jgi:pimeloyl-ACP methyl ester carboxylesterase
VPEWIEANGASLRYEMGGQGSETVVLVHELGGTLESWDLIAPVLQKEFRVLRYDQRGFGLSEKPRRPLSLDTIMGDLVGLLEALGIRTACHVMGSALGASIALAFAARHPAWAARVVACNPVIVVTGEDRRTYLEARAGGMEREGMRPYVDSALTNSYPEALRSDSRRFDWYRRRWLANDPFGLAAVSRMLLTLDLAGDLSRIACPVLVFAGRHDSLLPPAVVENTARAIRGARYVEIDSGHFMAVQTPERLLEHVLPFLRGRG